MLSDRGINNLNQETIVKIITESGLRGRGGAGFPTGKNGQSPDDKWCPQVCSL